MDKNQANEMMSYKSELMNSMIVSCYKTIYLNVLKVPKEEFDKVIDTLLEDWKSNFIKGLEERLTEYMAKERKDFNEKMKLDEDAGMDKIHNDIKEIFEEQTPIVQKVIDEMKNSFK